MVTKGREEDSMETIESEIQSCWPVSYFSSLQDCLVMTCNPPSLLTTEPSKWNILNEGFGNLSVSDSGSSWATSTDNPITCLDWKLAGEHLTMCLALPSFSSQAKCRQKYYFCTFLKNAFLPLVFPPMERTGSLVGFWGINPGIRFVIMPVKLGGKIRICFWIPRRYHFLSCMPVFDIYWIKHLS